MNGSLDEIMALHDAATACGCNCCDDDYCAYVERRKLSQNRSADDRLPDSAASQRKSLRYMFETQMTAR